MYGDAAKKAGAEKDNRFVQILEMTRLRALGDLYRLQLDEQARKISPDEIQAYFEKNMAGLEELHMRRFFLPKNNTANLQDKDFRARSAQLAKELRERAARGEDMDQLQKAGFDALGVRTTPATGLGPCAGGNLTRKPNRSFLR